MADTVQLSLGSDTINLNGGSYGSTSIIWSKPTLDDKGRLIRDIDFKLTITNTSGVDDAHAKFNALALMRTKLRHFIQTRYNGNPPGKSDGSWLGAIFTFKISAATKTLYYFVRDIELSLPSTYQTAGNIGSGKILEIPLKLTVEARPRGARVILRPGVRCGGMEEPFNPAVAIWQAGWSIDDVTKWSIDTTTAKIGKRSLKWANTAQNTIFTNPFDVVQGNVVVPQASALGTRVSGTATIVLQAWNGSTWADTAAVVASLTASVASWTDYPVTPVTYNVPAGISQCRLKIVTYTSGNMNFDRMACWVNPVGGVAPSEFMSVGGGLRQPQIVVYNTQGQERAPFKMKFVNKSGAGLRYLMIGGEYFDLTSEAPLYPFDIKLAGKDTDSFTRADSTSVPGQTDQGRKWYVQLGTAGILSNRFYFSVDTHLSLAFNYFGCDGTFQWTVRGTNGNISSTSYSLPRCVFRMLDHNTHLFVQLYAGQVYLNKWASGVETILTQTATTTADNTDYVVKVVLAGNSVSVYVDNVLKLSWTLTSGDTAFSNYAGAGQKLAYSAAGGVPATRATWDNFSYDAGVDTNMLWGEAAPVVTNALNITPTSVITQHFIPFDQALVKTMDLVRRPRRAFMVYAAPKVGSSTSNSAVNTVTTLINGQGRIFATRNFTVTQGNLPPTSANINGTWLGITNADYRILDLGNIETTRADGNWADKTQTLGLPVGSTGVALNESAIVGIAGLILLPNEQRAYLDLGASYSGNAVEVSSEGLDPYAGHYASASDNVPSTMNTIGGLYTGGDLYLLPCSGANQCMRFEALPFRDRDATYEQLFSYNVADSYDVQLEYTPVYSEVA